MNDYIYRKKLLEIEIKKRVKKVIEKLNKLNLKNIWKGYFKKIILK